MTEKPLEIEGTWEDIVSHSDTLAGCQVRVTVLSDPPPSQSQDKSPRFRPGSGRSFLRHAGTWSGDDLEECVNRVYETRRPLEF
jgi:hypothetical protein